MAADLAKEAVFTDNSDRRGRGVERKRRGEEERGKEKERRGEEGEETCQSETVPKGGDLTVAEEGIGRCAVTFSVADQRLHATMQLPQLQVQVLKLLLFLLKPLTHTHTHTQLH